MAKILIYDNEAKQKILAGVEKLEKAVVTTLGPSGKNVMIDNFGSIHSTKDGVSVASAITLKDPFEEMGAKAIKEVAEYNEGKLDKIAIFFMNLKNDIQQISLLWSNDMF